MIDPAKREALGDEHLLYKYDLARDGIKSGSNPVGRLLFT